MLTQTFDLVDENWHGREQLRLRGRRVALVALVIIVASGFVTVWIESVLYPPLIIAAVVLLGVGLLGWAAFWLIFRWSGSKSMIVSAGALTFQREVGSPIVMRLDLAKQKVRLLDWRGLSGGGTPAPKNRRPYSASVDRPGFGAGPVAVNQPAFEALQGFLRAEGFALVKSGPVPGTKGAVSFVYRR